MGWLWALIVGGIIGWIAGMIVGRDVPGGIIGNIIAGFIGGWLGNMLLGTWGPEIGGFFIIQAIIGAVFVISIVCAIMRSSRRSRGLHTSLRVIRYSISYDLKESVPSGAGFFYAVLL